MRSFDFSSWQGILTSIGGLLLITLIGMGIRLLMMMTIQARREKQNRQINERLKALIAAYKTLGGSFTGNLAVNPMHLRDLRRANIATPAVPDPDSPPLEPPSSESEATGEPQTVSDRARQIRDAVEAALSDIILFGTEEQVALASKAAQEMVAGRPVHVHEIVASLSNYIREALDLDPIPSDAAIPNQGPSRPGSGGKGSGGGGEGRSGGGGGGAGGGMGGMAMGGGMGMGAGMGLGVGLGHGGGETDPSEKP